MNDRAMAAALTQVQGIERQARTHFAASGADLAERDHAEVTIRQAVALKKMLERWITARQCRAALTNQ